MTRLAEHLAKSMRETHNIIKENIEKKQMIKPCGYYVLVKMEKVEQTTKSGIIIATPEQNKREQNGHYRGRLIAFGPTAYHGYAGCDGDTPEERASQWGVQLGDVVRFQRYDGTIEDDIDDDDNLYRYVQDGMIIGIKED